MLVWVALPRHAFRELAGARVLTFGLRYHVVLVSRSLLFQPVFVMQAPKDRMVDDVQMLWKLVPMPLPWHRERRGRLREARPQGHMGTTGIVMGYPFLQGGFQLSSDHGTLRSDDRPSTSAVFLAFSSYWKNFIPGKSLLC